MPDDEETCKVDAEIDERGFERDEFQAPSIAHGFVISLSMMLGALIIAGIIMLQWFLWFALTSQLFDMWGMLIGIAICAAQMLMLFSDKRPQEC